MPQTKNKLSVWFMSVLAVLAVASFLSCKNNDSEKEVASSSPAASTSVGTNTTPDDHLSHREVIVNCDETIVYTASEKTLQKSHGYWLVYIPPTPADGMHIGLYDWIDYGANGPDGPKGFKGFYDTTWQLSCVSGKAGSSALACPLSDPIVPTIREIVPKLVTAKTADQSTDPPGCAKYTDDPSTYMCNTVDKEADVDKLYCAGTWQLWHNGALIEEYTDAPRKRPGKDSHFEKMVIKSVDSPNATTYRVVTGLRL